MPDVRSEISFMATDFGAAIAVFDNEKQARIATGKSFRIFRLILASADAQQPSLVQLFRLILNP